MQRCPPSEEGGAEGDQSGANDQEDECASRGRGGTGSVGTFDPVRASSSAVIIEHAQFGGFTVPVAFCGMSCRNPMRGKMDEAMENQIVHAGSRIVVGVDGSPESVLALKWAQTLAGALDATITAVTAWQLETVFGSYVVPDWDPDANARRVLKDAVQEAFGDNRPDGFSGECVRGRPAQILMEYSKSAQMLIVGSRGRGGFTGMLLGSVSSACAEHASCPVLVVHRSADAATAAVRESGEGTDEPDPDS